MIESPRTGEIRAFFRAGNMCGTGSFTGAHTLAHVLLANDWADALQIEATQEAAAKTGKPVYVTEIGWPTALGQPSTGDSLQWSQADQATNLTNFMDWARGTGYVGAAVYFNYRDYGTNMWYGIESASGTKKPAYDALKAETAK